MGVPSEIWNIMILTSTCLIWENENLPGRVLSWIQSSSSSCGRLLNSPMIPHWACRLATPCTAMAAMTANTTTWCLNLSPIQPNTWHRDRGVHLRLHVKHWGDKNNKQCFPGVTFYEVGDAPVWNRWARPWCTCEVSGRAWDAWWGRPGRRTPAAADCGTPAGGRHGHRQSVVTGDRKVQRK